MSVLVIVPVLNRPARAAPTWDQLRDADGVKTMFVVSPHDLDERAALLKIAAPLIVAEWEPGPGDYAKKINLGYQWAFSRGFTWVFTGADDLVFHDGWLDQALAVAASTGAAVIGTNDLWNPAVRMRKHSTHTLVNVEYVTRVGASWDGPGFVLHEGYDHQCVDNELVAAAKLRDRWAFAQRSVVEHLHPFAHKAVMDDTYRKALARGRQDIALYQQRFRNAKANAHIEGWRIR